jgi:hypothetical protein
MHLSRKTARKWMEPGNRARALVPDVERF